MEPPYEFPMKRSWIPPALLIAVLCLLTAFLGLQYNWLVRAGDAERERMQRRAESDLRSFAEEFNREIQAAFFNFQVDHSVFEERNFFEFNERYDHWRSSTAFPSLIRGINYFPKDPNDTLMQYSPEQRTFIEAAPDAEIAEIRSAINSNPSEPLLEKNLALAVPIHNVSKEFPTTSARTPGTVVPSAIKMPPAAGYVVVRLDRQIMIGSMLPALRDKFFAGGEYSLSVADRSSTAVFGSIPEKPDAAAQLFDLRPNTLVFYSNRGLFPTPDGQRKAEMILDHRVESRTITRSAEAPPAEGEAKFTIQLQENQNGRPRNRILTRTASGDELWTLTATHSAGSIDQFVNTQRQQSMAIGIGLYLLLLASIGAIMISAVRSRRFAQRQVDFVSSVSHEFRTPLAVIYSAGENLADGVTKDEGQIARYGELIKAEGKKLGGMVEQILEFAGARSGNSQYSFADADVSSIINDAIEECRPALEVGEFEIETDLAETLPPINADRAALSRALQNLIGNTLKYANGHRWVRIAASNGNGQVRITVEDRGIGIPRSELKKVFEPFYRSRSVVDAQIHGNGLGLSLVKDIVNAHGGTITAESEPGKGSKFTIELPSRT
jgi:signal transduction histidine kinase